MRTITRTSITLIAVFVCAVTATGQSKNTDNTLALDDPKNMPKATIQEIAWLAGHWQGPALGGLSDEYWSTPMAGAMMGMYRLVKDQKIVFYELFRVAEENGSLILRLKHFHPDMKGWEEKDVTVTFPLVKIGREEAWFDGMTFKKTGPDSLTAYVAMGKKGAVREERFTYTRVQKTP
jgi:Domain of unknown function (DUF6265)